LALSGSDCWSKNVPDSSCLRAFVPPLLPKWHSFQIPRPPLLLAPSYRSVLRPCVTSCADKCPPTSSLILFTSWHCMSLFIYFLIHRFSSFCTGKVNSPGVEASLPHLSLHPSSWNTHGHPLGTLLLYFTYVFIFL
jgi:hypothetical protein